MEHGTALLITIVAAVGFGLLAQIFAHRWHIPAIVLLLARQLAHDGFGIERANPSLSNPAKGANPALLKQTGGKLAFGRFISVADWNKTGTEIHELIWQFPPGRAAADARDISLPADFIPILRIRNGSAEIVHAEQSWQPGDTIILLSLHAPDEAQSTLDQI